MPTADAVSAPGERAAQPNPWWTKRAAALHVTLVVVVPVFLGLFWWQVQRVRQGNTLSWAYVFEWPFFTGYAVYLWWKLVHDQPGLTPTPAASAPASPPPAAAAVAHDGAAAPAGGGRAAGVAAGGNGGAADRPFLATGTAAGATTSGSAATTEDVHTETASEEAGGGEDDELAAYNRYLAELNASGRRKSW